MAPHTRSVLVVTGETSGEQHAAGLIRQLESQKPEFSVQWFGSGGTRMAAAGVSLLTHVSQLSAIGPWEAAQNLRHYWKLYRRILREARRRQPCLAILVDFPEFNLNLAGRLKAMKIPVCYFIGPQVWAWRPGRINQIRRNVDLMLVILPFEEEFYRKHGVEARYVGNPTLSLNQIREASGNGQQEGPPRGTDALVALLPGSRRKEVDHILPVQLKAASWVARSCQARFLVSQAPEISGSQLLEIYQAWQHEGNDPLSLEISKEPAHQILSRATCAMVKSGTSTLEATVLQVPFAMVYRVSSASWYLARPLVGTDTYCLANLIAGRKIVPEFVQAEATAEGIGSYVKELLMDADLRKRVRGDLAEAAGRLGDRDAYQESARHVIRMIMDQTHREEKRP